MKTWIKGAWIGIITWIAFFVLSSVLFVLDNIVFCRGDNCGTFLSLISLVLSYMISFVPILFEKVGLNNNSFFLILGVILNMGLYILVGALICVKFWKVKQVKKR